MDHASADCHSLGNYRNSGRQLGHGRCYSLVGPDPDWRGQASNRASTLRATRSGLPGACHARPTACLRHGVIDCAHHEPQRKPLADETILEFFENLAHLTRDHVLNHHVVCNYFSVAIEGYWHASRDFVIVLRAAERDTELYSDLEWLATELASISAKRARRPVPLSRTREKMNDYLRSEQALT